MVLNTLGHTKLELERNMWSCPLPTVCNGSLAHCGGCGSNTITDSPTNLPDITLAPLGRKGTLVPVAPAHSLAPIEWHGHNRSTAAPSAAGNNATSSGLLPDSAGTLANAEAAKPWAIVLVLLLGVSAAVVAGCISRRRRRRTALISRNMFEEGHLLELVDQGVAEAEWDLAGWASEREGDKWGATHADTGTNHMRAVL